MQRSAPPCGFCTLSLPPAKSKHGRNSVLEPEEFDEAEWRRKFVQAK
jgi:hypothetical protein